MTRLSAGEVSVAWDRADRKTLGQLLRDVARKVEISPETEAALADALDDRNYLFHRFFAKRNVDFGSNPGRRDMIAELRAMTKRFQMTDRLVDAVTIPLWNVLGLTQDFIEAELARKQGEMDHREVSG